MRDSNPSQNQFQQQTCYYLSLLIGSTIAAPALAQTPSAQPVDSPTQADLEETATTTSPTLSTTQSAQLAAASTTEPELSSTSPKFSHSAQPEATWNFITTRPPLDRDETNLKPLSAAIAPPAIINEMTDRVTVPAPPLEVSDSYTEQTVTSVGGLEISANEEMGAIVIPVPPPLMTEQTDFSNTSDHQELSSSNRENLPASIGSSDADTATAQVPTSNQFLDASFQPTQPQLLLAQVVRFKDTQNHWAEGFITALAARRIVAGFPDGTFRPDKVITRAEYAALLDRAFKQSPVRSGRTFRDVPANYWAASTISSAYRKGFFPATGQSFGPQQFLPRAQSLAILGDGLNYQIPNDPNQVLTTYFRDADQTPSELEGLVAATTTNQVVVSYPDVDFLRPNRETTRAEAASFVHQALVKRGIIPPLGAGSLATNYVAGLKPIEVTTSSFPTTQTPSSSNAQLPSRPSAGTVQSVKDRLRAYQELDNFGNIFKGSPAITIANPPAYGADDFLLFTSATFQSRTRFTNQADGALGIGIGLFDALETVGLELSYTAASFGNSRPFGAGGFNAKLHRAFPGDWAIAAGVNGFITTNDSFGDFKDSWYGSVTKIFRTSDSIEDPFSRVALTVGFGGGQFRPLQDVRDAAGNRTGVTTAGSIGVFSSLAVRVADPLTAIVEWTGQDLAMGLSIRPIENVNWTITPAVRDLAGGGLDGARFVLGTSFSIKL